MNIKQYQRARLILTIVLAIIFSQAIVFKNYLIPISFLIAGYLIMIYMRRQVKEIIADERDYEIGGKSALLTIQIYAWTATICMLIMYSLRDLNPAYEPIAMALAYSTCVLMIVYGLIFKFKSRAKFSKNRNSFIAFIIVLAILAAIFTLRLFSSEDNWICKDGKWTPHGHPSFSAPAFPCK
jgi:uncharacterized membrane protein